MQSRYSKRETPKFIRGVSLLLSEISPPPPVLSIPCYRKSLITILPHIPRSRPPGSFLLLPAALRKAHRNTGLLL